MSLSLGARAYVWFVAIAAMGMLAYWQQAWPLPLAGASHPLGLMAILTGLAIVTIHFPLPVAPKRKVNLSLAIYFACLLLFGPPAAIVRSSGVKAE